MMKQWVVEKRKPSGAFACFQSIVSSQDEGVAVEHLPSQLNTNLLTSYDKFILFIKPQYTSSKDEHPFPLQSRRQKQLIIVRIINQLWRQHTLISLKEILTHSLTPTAIFAAMLQRIMNNHQMAPQLNSASYKAVIPESISQKPKDCTLLLALSGTAYSLEGHLFKNIVASNETASFEDNILKPIQVTATDERSLRLLIHHLLLLFWILPSHCHRIDTQEIKIKDPF